MLRIAVLPLVEQVFEAMVTVEIGSRGYPVAT